MAGTDIRLPGSSNGGASLVSLTYNALSNLASTFSIVPGQFYLITDRGDEGIIVQGATTTTIDTNASGLFLNADYGAAGDYSGVPGFVNQLGVWTALLAPVVGSVVIWDNQHWINTTGVNGVTNPSVDAINWTLITGRTRTHGYIPVADSIDYVLSADVIQARNDYNSNYVYGPLALQGFPWGNSIVTGCRITGGSIQLQNTIGTIIGFFMINGSCTSTGFLGAISGATIDGGVLILDGMSGTIISCSVNGNSSTADFTNANGSYQLVTVNGASTFSVAGATATANVQSVTLDQGATLNAGNLAGTIINSVIEKANVTARMSIGITAQNITVTLPVTFTINPAANISNKSCREGFSNFEGTLTFLQERNNVAIVYAGLAGGPYQVGETITDSNTGFTAIVVAVGSDGLSLICNTFNGEMTVGGTLTGGTSGATSTSVSFESIVLIHYNTLVGGPFQYGETVTDTPATGNSGDIVVDDGVGIMGLRNVTGSMNNGDSISGGTSLATATINAQTQYLSLVISSAQRHVGRFFISTTNTDNSVGSIIGLSADFNTWFRTQNNGGGVPTISIITAEFSTSGGNVYLPLLPYSPAPIQIALQTTKSFAEFFADGSDVIYYNYRSF